MLDVWVAGAFDAGEVKQAVGAWVCPTLDVYAVTKRCKAVGLNDGLRVGYAVAILSAINALGDDLTIHLPEYPNPRWVADPKRPVPLQNLMYRLLYRMEVHPRIESKTIKIVRAESSFYEAQLHKLLTRGEAPKACML